MPLCCSSWVLTTATSSTTMGALITPTTIIETMMELLHFGEAIWADTKIIPVGQPQRASKAQKASGYKSVHLPTSIAIPHGYYVGHLSSVVYRCQSVTWLPPEQRLNPGFTPNIQWPHLEQLDHIEQVSFQTSVHLRDAGTSLKLSPQHGSPQPDDLQPPQLEHPAMSKQPKTSSIIRPSRQASASEATRFSSTTTSRTTASAIWASNNSTAPTNKKALQQASRTSRSTSFRSIIGRLDQLN